MSTSSQTPSGKIDDPDVESGLTCQTPTLLNADDEKSRRRFFRRTFGRPDRDLSTSARVRRDIQPRQGRRFDLNKGNALKVCFHHKEYTYGGTTLRGLARFDALRDYGIAEIAEAILIEKEIDRLISAIRDEGPFLFDSKGIFTTTREEVFAEVSGVADQIRVNFEIIRHDNVMHILQHCPDLKDHAVRNFKRARRKLYGRYKQDQTNVQGCQPRLLHPPQRNMEAYFSLVDYITATIGRVLMRIATSKYWEKHMISILAQWATKLKVLSENPAHYAAQSLDNGEQFTEQFVASIEEKQKLFLKIKLSENEKEKEDVDILDAETELSAQYYKESTLLRRLIERLVKNALDALLNPEDNSDAAGCFEMCTLIYGTGLGGLSTTLSNSREGNISASSDAVRVNCTYAGLELLMQIVEALLSGDREAQRLGTQTSQSEHAALLRWEWAGVPGAQQYLPTDIKVSQMDNLVSLLVPLSLTSTYSSSIMDQLIHLASTGTEEEDPIVQFEPPPKEFYATLTISTARFLQKQDDQAVKKYHDPDICSVSDSSTRLGLWVRANAQKAIHERSDRDTNIETKARKVLATYEKDSYRMSTWIISEDAIIIKCRAYVAMIIAICTFVIFGGLSVPFAVGTKIRGVDPFQLTNFSWLFAGFIAILAKSRYVNEWPWHDFLRGQVVCRSVKDVCDVTAIDPQLVLMNLLHEERDNTLKTKGPYNGMFGRKAEGVDGFAIDEPVHLSTMLASGFIILKVLNEKGEHLICMDVRKGTEGDAPIKNETEQYLSCLNVGKDELEHAFNSESLQASQVRGEQTSSKRRSSKKQEKVIKLSASEFSWHKVLGLYIRDSKFG